MPAGLPVFAAFIVVLVAALREQLEQETMHEERERFDRVGRKIDALAALVAARGDVPAGR